MHKCWYIVHCVSVDSVMFWQTSLKLVLHYLGFRSWAQVFLSFSITLIMGVILCKDNNKIAHFKPAFLASGSDNSVHILLMLLTQSSSPSSSRNKMQQNHVRSNKTCTVWQASFQIKKDYITHVHFWKETSYFLDRWVGIDQYTKIMFRGKRPANTQ